MSRRARIRYLKSPAEIPHFKDEAEEARFWDSHSPVEIVDQLRPVRLRLVVPLGGTRGRRPAAGQAAPLIDRKQIEQVRRIARRKAVSSRALIKKWIAEGIRRETRGAV